MLVFDNRGVGHSSVPKGPYTYVDVWMSLSHHSHIHVHRTRNMADDAIALLNYVGWTEARDLHVVGVSLGGMIAQGTFLQHLHTLGPPRNADHEA